MKKTKAFYMVVVLAVSALLLSSVNAQTIPEDARRHMARGQTAVEMAKSTADYEDASREFEQAKKLAPAWPDVYYNLGLILEKTGNYDEAILNLRTYLQLAPASTDAARIQETIYKLEYKRERSNIEGIWKVDRNEMNVKCDPAGYAINTGTILSSIFTVEDIQMEIKKGPDGLKARVLSSKHRYGRWLPDGPYVTVRRDGDIIKIFDAVMNTCNTTIQNDHCPWKAKFILKQTAANALEGTIEVNGIAKKVVNYRSFALESVGLNCNGKIILNKEGSAR